MDNECTHEKKYDLAQDNFYLCKLCGLLIHKNVYAYKPKRYEYTVEINALEFFENMKKSCIFIPNDKVIKNTLFTGKRNEMIKLLNSIIHKLRFRSQTFYLAIYYLDLLMDITTEIRVEIATICALLLAAKFDENDTTVPNLPYFRGLMENYFISLEDIKKNEVVCLSLLEYKLDHITPYHFINFFLSQGIIFSDEVISTSSNRNYISNNFQSSSSVSEASSKIISKDVAKLSMITKEVLLLFIEDTNYKNHSPLHIACGCVAAARDSFKMKEPWPQRLSDIYKVKLEDFINCYEIIKGIHQKRKCYLKEQEINSFLSNKKQIHKENIVNIEDTELKKDSERERALFSDENVMKNIKLKIEQQIKEKEIQLISERNSHYRRASQDNYEWYHFSNEENESKLRNNLIIEEKNLKYKEVFREVKQESNDYEYLSKGQNVKNSLSLINKTRELLSTNNRSVHKKNSFQTQTNNINYNIKDYKTNGNENKTLTQSKLSVGNLHNNIYYQDRNPNKFSRLNILNYNKEKLDIPSNIIANYSNNYSKISRDKNYMERVYWKDNEQTSHRVYNRINNTKEILENLHK